MLRLAWLTVRARTAGFAGSLTALAFALTLLTACGVLMESALRVENPTERYAAADVVIAGQQRVSPAQPLLERLRALPGAAAVTPEVSFPASVVTAGGEVLGGPEGGASLGHSWESAVLAPYILRTGRPPAADDEVLLDTGLARRAGVGPGDRVVLATAETPRPYTVTGLAESPLSPARQSALFFSATRAARLAGGGGRPVDAIGLRAGPGVSPGELAGRVEEVIEALHPETDTDTQVLYASDVLTGDRIAESEFAHVRGPGDSLSSFAGTFGAFALFVAVFVVAGTLALSVQQRMREIGLLRAVAATPRQIRRMIASETLIVTLAAALIGGPLGIGLAALLRAELARRGVIPDAFPLRVGPTALLSVLALGIVAAQLAVLVSARRASRIHPTQVLREAAAPSPRPGYARVLAGVAVVAAAGVPLFSIARDRDQDGAGDVESMLMLLMIGVALLGPVLGRVGSVVLGAPIARLFPVGGFLAGTGTRAQYRRLAAAVTPFVLAISFTVTLTAVPTLKAEAAETRNSQRLRADHVVESSGIGLPGRYAAEARRLPGITAATGLMPLHAALSANSEDGGDGDGGTRTHDGPGYAVAERDLPALLDLDVRAGSLDRLRGPSIALGEESAGELGAAVGDRITVSWEDGTRSRLRVAAVYARDRGFADVLLPRGLAAPHTPAPLDDTVLLRTAPTEDPGAVRERLDALTDRYPMARVTDRASYDRAVEDRRKSSGSITLLLLAMIGSFTAIAVVNTLAMSTMERSQEFAALRLIGATRRQVLRAMLWEAGITVALAVALGALVCAAVLVPASLALTGSAVPPLSVGLVAGVLGGSVGLGLLTVLFTARVALSRPTAKA
ncbi:ABC transporter permease [Streptomyces inusitatus]|uniref:ABC transporter permease n=1 Tax=Streptomyces inusitatus TaxID=68221 RepID=A0A918Q565_9ACTN|nr:FtsX-like permease family protein [Streptomyces inusitatus]GGZ32154.1 ABC transporter permease [Streptomyces inusitatus]